MKHIPTTATALRKIKAAAKRLRDAQGIPLAQAQDAAAREAGYEHFHHATACATRTGAARPSRFTSLGQLRFLIDEGTADWPVYDADGTERERVPRQAGLLVPGADPASLADATDSLDDTLDHLEGNSGDLNALAPAQLEKLIAICQQLTATEPAFLEGYATWAGALVALDRAPECIRIARPVYDAACALVPGSFEGFIPYPRLENRPFHRLAVNLLLAHLRSGQHDEARAIAQRMLQWWPNDNIGFRFLLEDMS